MHFFSVSNFAGVEILQAEMRPCQKVRDRFSADNVEQEEPFVILKEA
jgi:hypothetical protein